ncbi:MAG: membrane integrity-associated transporter subunit PqiC [Hyphomonas sp.]|nr:membrane integrity-associated transporter subunit PqiC [Hyphomonas sp.]
MIRSLSTLPLALVMTACVSVLPPPDVPEGLYRFGAMPAEHSVQSTVLVREPDASRLFGGRAIASEDSTGALRLVRGVEWTDSATRMMQLALLDSLGGEGARAAVSAESGAQADYELSWRLSDFTLAGTNGRCSLEATLVDARTRAVVAQANVSTSASASGSDNPSRAGALIEAGRACVREVGDFVAEKAVPDTDLSGS